MYPQDTNHCLYRDDLTLCYSDPEGTFGRNQQLTDSMSLSPLHPSETSDLHVSIETNLQFSFPNL